MPGAILDSNGLTAKREKYCQGIASGLTGTDAYRKAFSAGRMKNTTIASRASALKKLPKVASRIAQLLGKAVDATSLEGDRVIQELITLSFSRITDYGRWDNDSFDLTSSEHLTDAQARALESITYDEVTTTTGQGDKVRVEVTRKFRFKLWNKLDALEKLAKILRMYTGEVPPGIPDINVHVPIVISPEAIVQAAMALKAAGVVVEDVPYQVSEGQQNGAAHGN